MYKEYKINYDLIEEYMTEFLLKNKKMLNDDIIEFVYNNELFGNKISDLTTLFRKKYNCKIINLYDKVEIYKFSLSNNNINLCKNIINDFKILIEYLNEKREDVIKNDCTINEETKIDEVIKELKDKVSNEFNLIFDKKEGLTVDKILGIFDYYLKLIYNDISKEIKNYQVKLEPESIKIINDYYNKEHYLSKNALSYAIRLFITLVLLPEDDKENKIKFNRNNFINYLKVPDLWKEDIHKEEFNKNLNELKSFNVKINQIIHLYEILGRDFEENFFEDVKEQIEKEKNAKKIDEMNKSSQDEKNKDKEYDKNSDDDDDDDDDDDKVVDPFAKKHEDSSDGSESD